jgi:hypothetical protein
MGGRRRYRFRWCSFVFTAIDVQVEPNITFFNVA